MAKEILNPRYTGLKGTNLLLSDAFPGVLKRNEKLTKNNQFWKLETRIGPRKVPAEEWGGRPRPLFQNITLILERTLKRQNCLRKPQINVFIFDRVIINERSS